MDEKEKNINEYRTMLFSIAYNMLGTIADAEDMVQETYMSWLASDKSHVENTRFYLIRTVSNKCLTHLKKIKQKRETYTGTWLPEPLLYSLESESNLETKNNLSIGFLYLLEKLTPIERGVIILKEAFDMNYDEIAKIFNINNESSRQHLSRAKKKLAHEKNRFKVNTTEHEIILRKFLDACFNQNLQELIELLREDVVIYGDGGGNPRTIKQPIEGKENAITLLMVGMKNAGPFSRMEILSVNGLSGAAFFQNSQKSTPEVLVAIDIDESQKIMNVYFMANSEKIRYMNHQKFN